MRFDGLLELPCLNFEVSHYMARLYMFSLHGSRLQFPICR